MKSVLAFLLMLSLATAAWGELAPHEVAIIAVAGSPASRQLAEHYAKARGVPTSQIFLLEGKTTVTLDQAVWQDQVRPAIRDWLAKQGLEKKIRCFVTCWDVPLRIGRRSSTARVVVERNAFLAQARQSSLGQIEGLFQAMDSLGATGTPPARPALDPKATARQLATELDKALQAARTRVQGILAEAERKQADAALEKIFLAGGGTSSLLGAMAKPKETGSLSAEVAQRLELIKAQTQGLQQGLQALQSLPDTLARDVQVLHLLRHTGGVIGSLRWIEEQQRLLEKNETYASFDSELSLVLWPDYPIAVWLPNPLHYAFDNVAGKHPTVMVSRLTATTPDLATKLVDNAIATEKTGLTGKVYLDAKGEKYQPGPNHERGSLYGKYDQSIRDLAELLKKHTKLEVVLNNEPRLFQKGECPDAALYCGWYSLANYVDAFTWRPGSVGYHIASSEAVELQRPGSKVWCNAMLERGICATLGPVEEPYLSAFPLPEDFFSLLLTGRYTLVETYYRTSLFNSWVMVLVGDPLYNPFKNHPQLDESALPDRLKAKKPAGN